MFTAKLFRFDGGSGSRLGIEDEQGRRFDLTAASPEAFASVAAWLALPDPVSAVREVTERAAAYPVPEGARVLCPLDRQEVWASGVTYERSREARKEESEGGGDFYDRVYGAERPELFFKAAPRLVRGPGEPLRIRRDSSWNVPEPELALVVSAAGRVVGLTAGNDMSSRSIEGENPLYLPQAKIYDGCCALGPAIALLGGGGGRPGEGALDPRALSIKLTILRDGEAAFTGETSTSRMRRSPEELVDYLTRELPFPDGVFLMTGTGIVPPDAFTLKSGDVVEIEVSGIGTLVNPVE